MSPRKRKRSARDLELLEVSKIFPESYRIGASSGEAMAMLVRRGFRPESTNTALPFPEKMEDECRERLADARQ